MPKLFADTKASRRILALCGAGAIRSSGSGRPSEKEISASPARGREIRAHIPDGAVLIALCVEGRR
jgi:hypothetical protein